MKKTNEQDDKNTGRFTNADVIVIKKPEKEKK